MRGLREIDLPEILFVRIVFATAEPQKEKYSDQYIDFPGKLDSKVSKESTLLRCDK
jgi:hypothetical protein